MTQGRVLVLPVVRYHTVPYCRRVWGVQLGGKSTYVWGRGGPIAVKVRTCGTCLQDHVPHYCYAGSTVVSRNQRLVRYCTYTSPSIEVQERQRETEVETESVLLVQRERERERRSQPTSVASRTTGTTTYGMWYPTCSGTTCQLPVGMYLRTVQTKKRCENQKKNVKEKNYRSPNYNFG